jgi:hypothetical protein
MVAGVGVAPATAANVTEEGAATIGPGVVVAIVTGTVTLCVPSLITIPGVPVATGETTSVPPADDVPGLLVATALADT